MIYVLFELAVVSNFNMSTMLHCVQFQHVYHVTDINVFCMPSDKPKL
jgi:hypothetical protein